MLRLVKHEPDLYPTEIATFPWRTPRTAIEAILLNWYFRPTNSGPSMFQVDYYLIISFARSQMLAPVNNWLRKAI
jgi:hypothetical protein